MNVDLRERKKPAIIHWVFGLYKCDYRGISLAIFSNAVALAHNRGGKPEQIRNHAKHSKRMWIRAWKYHYQVEVVDSSCDITIVTQNETRSLFPTSLKHARKEKVSENEKRKRKY